MSARGHVLAQDPTAGTDFHKTDDRFVPIRVSDLIAAICADRERFGPNAAGLCDFANELRAVVDQEAADFEHAVTDHYAAFDPDCDTIGVDASGRQQSADARTHTLAELNYVLEKANFTRLSDAQIDKAIRTANSYGLKVRIHPERVESIAIWVRGHSRHEHRRKSWRHPVRGEPRTLDLYRRLAVVVQLADDPHLIIKVFKDIPEADIEALLPHAEIQMSWFDRITMLGGGAGAAGTTGMKIFGLIAKVAALSKLAWVLVIGAGTIAVRTFLGYRRARQTRDSQRTRHLYYRNLANNGGALHRLIALITQEEVKEALLAYVFCRVAAEPVRSESELRMRIESYLRVRFGVCVDFDIADALESLTRLGLWADRERLEVLPIDRAVSAVREHWRERRSSGYHERMAAAVRS